MQGVGRRGRPFAVAVAACALVTGSLGALGPAPAGAAPTAAPACGDTLTADTTLTADLTCAGDALRLAPGVTLDLAGHRVSGDGSGVGIGIEEAGAGAETRVVDGTVRGFATGLEHLGTVPFGDRARLRLDDVALVRAPAHLEMTDVEIEDSTLTRSPVAVWSSDLEAEGSTFTRSSVGGEMDTLTLRDSTVVAGGWGDDENTDVVIDGSTLDADGYGGRPVTSFRGLTISDSRITGYRHAVFGAGPQVTVTDSVFAGAVGTGIGLQAVSDRVVVARTRFVGNRTHGMRVLGAETLRVTGSVFRANGAGLTIKEALPTSTRTVVHSTFRDNAGNGLTSGAPGVRIGSVTALDNGGYGIRAKDAVDLGGNRAAGNGVRDCVGVVCAAP